MKYDNCNKLFVLLTISSLLLLGSVSNTVLADNYYVDCALGADDASNGELPGICAWKTITYALSQVNGSESNPATINVAACTYDSTNAGEVFPLNMKSHVSLQGAGQ